MMHHRFSSLVLSLVLGAWALAAPRPAAAQVATTTFDTVDAVEISNGTVGSGTPAVNIRVTGIVVGASNPTTKLFQFANENAEGAATAAALRCERFALIAQSKPGKYQLAIGSFGTLGVCKLILRTA